MEIISKIIGRPKQDLISVSHLRKTIEATLITPYIKNEKPVSLLIVAKPESGKTTIIKTYQPNKGIIYVSDCTAYGISRDILPKIWSGEVKTIIIPDLLTPLSKSHKTRQTFIAFLNNLIEEGVAKITTYSTVWDKEVKANLITAVTDQALRDGRHEWAKIGFLSRFILFTYSYGLSTVQKIFEDYDKHGLMLETAKIDFPKKEVGIDLPEETSKKLTPIAVAIGSQLGLYGIRAKIQLRSFIKALAYLNGRKTVTEEDYQELLKLSDYMNFDFNPLE